MTEATSVRSGGRPASEIVGRLGRQSVGYALASIVGPGTGLLLLPVYTRFLAPADYGLIALLEIVSLLLGTIFSFGITAMVPFYYVDLPPGERRQRALGTVLIGVTLLNIALAVVTATLSRPLIHLVLPGIPFSPFVPLLAVTAFLDPYWNVFGSILQIEERAFTFSMTSLGRILLSMGLRIFWVVILQRGVYGFIVANLMTSAIVALGVLPYLYREMAFGFEPRELTRAFALGGPTVPNNLLTYGFRTMDRVVMDRYVGREDIGLYYMALRIADVMRLVSDVFVNAWRPIFFKEAGDRSFVDATVPALVRSVSVAFIVIWFFAALFSREAIALLTAPAYHGAAVFVPALAGAMTIKAIYSFPYLVVWFRKKTMYVPALTLATLVFSIGANLVLAPRFGPQGVAVSLLLSYLVLFALMVWVSQRLYPLRYPWKALVSAAAVAGATGVIGARIEPSVVGEIAKLGLVAMMALGLLATGAVRRADVQQAVSIVRAVVRPRAGGTGMPGDRGGAGGGKVARWA